MLTTTIETEIEAGTASAPTPEATTVQELPPIISVDKSYKLDRRHAKLLRKTLLEVRKICWTEPGRFGKWLSPISFAAIEYFDADPRLTKLEIAADGVFTYYAGKSLYAIGARVIGGPATFVFLMIPEVARLIPHSKDDILSVISPLEKVRTGIGQSTLRGRVLHSRIFEQECRYEASFKIIEFLSKIAPSALLRKMAPSRIKKNLQPKIEEIIGEPEHFKQQALVLLADQKRREAFDQITQGFKAMDHQPVAHNIVVHPYANFIKPLGELAYDLTLATSLLSYAASQGSEEWKSRVSEAQDRLVARRDLINFELEQWCLHAPPAQKISDLVRFGIVPIYISKAVTALSKTVILTQRGLKFKAANPDLFRDAEILLQEMLNASYVTPSLGYVQEGDQLFLEPCVLPDTATPLLYDSKKIVELSDTGEELTTTFASPNLDSLGLIDLTGLIDRDDIVSPSLGKQYLSPALRKQLAISNIHITSTVHGGIALGVKVGQHDTAVSAGIGAGGAFIVGVKVELGAGSLAASLVSAGLAIGIGGAVAGAVAASLYFYRRHQRHIEHKIANAYKDSVISRNRIILELTSVQEKIDEYEAGILSKALLEPQLLQILAHSQKSAQKIAADAEYARRRKGIKARDALLKLERDLTKSQANLQGVQKAIVDIEQAKSKVDKCSAEGSFAEVVAKIALKLSVTKSHSLGKEDVYELELLKRLLIKNISTLDDSKEAQKLLLQVQEFTFHEAGDLALLQFGGKSFGTFGKNTRDEIKDINNTIGLLNLAIGRGEAVTIGLQELIRKIDSFIPKWEQRKKEHHRRKKDKDFVSESQWNARITELRQRREQLRAEHLAFQTQGNKPTVLLSKEELAKLYSLTLHQIIDVKGLTPDTVMFAKLVETHNKDNVAICEWCDKISADFGKLETFREQLRLLNSLIENTKTDEASVLAQALKKEHPTEVDLNKYLDGIIQWCDQVSIQSQKIEILNGQLSQVDLFIKDEKTDEAYTLAQELKALNPENLKVIQYLDNVIKQCAIQWQIILQEYMKTGKITTAYKLAKELKASYGKDLLVVTHCDTTIKNVYISFVNPLLMAMNLQSRIIGKHLARYGSDFSQRLFEQFTSFYNLSPELIIVGVLYPISNRFGDSPLVQSLAQGIFKKQVSDISFSCTEVTKIIPSLLPLALRKYVPFSDYMSFDGYKWDSLATKLVPSINLLHGLAMLTPLATKYRRKLSISGRVLSASHMAITGHKIFKAYQADETKDPSNAVTFALDAGVRTVFNGLEFCMGDGSLPENKIWYVLKDGTKFTLTAALLLAINLPKVAPRLARFKWFTEKFDQMTKPLMASLAVEGVYLLTSSCPTEDACDAMMKNAYYHIQRKQYALAKESLTKLEAELIRSYNGLQYNAGDSRVIKAAKECIFRYKLDEALMGKSVDMYQTACYIYSVEVAPDLAKNVRLLVLQSIIASFLKDDKINTHTVRILCSIAARPMHMRLNMHDSLTSEIYYNQANVYFLLNNLTEALISLDKIPTEFRGEQFWFLRLKLITKLLSNTQSADTELCLNLMIYQCYNHIIEALDKKLLASSDITDSIRQEFILQKTKINKVQDLLAKHIGVGASISSQYKKITEEDAWVSLIAASKTSNLISDFIEQHQMRLIENVGEGNCLFYAIADQIGVDHIRLRQIAVRSLRMLPTDHPVITAIIQDINYQGLEDYIIKMQTSTTWGGEAEIYALAKWCNRPILVFAADHESYFLVYGAEFSGEPILLHYADNHYRELTQGSFRSKKAVLEEALRIQRDSAISTTAPAAKSCVRVLSEFRPRPTGETSTLLPEAKLRLCAS